MILRVDPSLSVEVMEEYAKLLSIFGWDDRFRNSVQAVLPSTILTHNILGTRLTQSRHQVTPWETFIYYFKDRENIPKVILHVLEIVALKIFNSLTRSMALKS